MSPRIVLVHGFTQSGASWAPIVARLCQALPAAEIATPDLAGHGTAPLPVGDLHEEAARLARDMTDGAARLARDMTDGAARLARDMTDGAARLARDMTDGAAGEPAVLVGYSAGGRVCLHLALDHPDLVSALVLVSATAGIDDAAERAARRAADGKLADRIEAGGNAGLAEWLEEWLSGPLFARLDPTEADLPSRLGNTAPGLANSLRHHGTGTQEPLWDRLPELNMPVLIIAGAEDVKFSRLAERLTASIGANASLRIVEGAGHAVPAEQPDTVADLIADLAGPP